MPTIARELRIVYAGFTIGGSTERLIDGHTKIEDSFTGAAFEVSFIVHASTEALFEAACTAAENAFRVPWGDLEVFQGSQTLKSLKQSNNTGFDCVGRIIKGESLADTGRSRRYTVRFEFGRPADNAGTLGRRSSSTAVSYNASRRRRVTLSGVWTAVPTTGDAYTQYMAQIATWATTELAYIDATTGWEKVEEPRVEYDTNKKLLDFTVIFQERVYPDAGQATAVLDDPAIVDQVFRVGWEAEAPGDSPSSPGAQGGGGSSFSTGSGGSTTGVMVPNPPTQGGTATTSRMGKIHLHWEASIDKTITTDLMSKYTGTIRPWLITEAAKVMAAGYGPLALVNENYDLDRTDNRSVVDMEFWALGPANIIEQKVNTKETTVSYGHVLVAAWTGNPRSKYRYQGPSQQLRTVTEVRTVRNATNDVLGREPMLGSGIAPVSFERDRRNRRIGLPGQQFDVVDLIITSVIELYDELGGGGGAGGSPVGPGGVATPSPGNNFFPPGSNVVT